jgi:hypothetical protein
MWKQVMNVIEEANLLVQSELLRILAKLLQAHDATPFVTLDHLKIVMNLMRSRDTLKGALSVFTVIVVPSSITLNPL